jgi:hypothetical protein
MHHQPQGEGGLADLGATEDDEAHVVAEGGGQHALVVGPDGHRPQGQLVPGQQRAGVGQGEGGDQEGGGEATTPTTRKATTTGRSRTDATWWISRGQSVAAGELPRSGQAWAALGR